MHLASLRFTKNTFTHILMYLSRMLSPFFFSLLLLFLTQLLSWLIYFDNKRFVFFRLIIFHLCTIFQTSNVHFTGKLLFKGHISTFHHLFFSDRISKYTFNYYFPNSKNLFIFQTKANKIHQCHVYIQIYLWPAYNVNLKMWFQVNVCAFYWEGSSDYIYLPIDKFCGCSK